jgi:hypothetical protein
MKKLYGWILVQRWLSFRIRAWAFLKVSSPCEPQHACQTHGMCWNHPKWGYGEPSKTEGQ